MANAISPFCVLSRCSDWREGTWKVETHSLFTRTLFTPLNLGPQIEIGREWSLIFRMTYRHHCRLARPDTHLQCSSVESTPTIIDYFIGNYWFFVVVVTRFHLPLSKRPPHRNLNSFWNLSQTGLWIYCLLLSVRCYPYFTRWLSLKTPQKWHFFCWAKTL